MMNEDFCFMVESPIFMGNSKELLRLVAYRKKT